jgi:ribosomal protein S24E
MKVVKDEKSFALPRREIIIEFPHTEKPTPSEEQVNGEIVKKFKCKEELIAIKKIKTKFGSTEAIVEVYIYDDLDSMKKIERIKEKKEEPKPVEKPAEAKKDGEETKTKEQSNE